jgi:nitroreductase
MEDYMLSIDELHELAQNRRSIRGYDRTKDVPEEMVRRILDCARWGPSGGNGQPWEFIVVRDEKTRHQIADIFLKQQEHKKEPILSSTAFYVGLIPMP